MSFLDEAIAALQSHDTFERRMEGLTNVIKKYKELGYAQSDIYCLLIAVLQEDRTYKQELYEEEISEIGDYVAGSVARQTRLWPNYVSDPFYVWHNKEKGK